MARKLKFDFKAIAMDALALSGGAAAAGIIDSMLLSKMAGGNLDPKIKALIKIAAGAIIPPMIAKGKSAKFFDRFGDGIVTIGGYQLLHSVLPGQIPAISGIGQNLLAYPQQVSMGALPQGTNLPTMSGDLPTVSGDELPTVSGIGSNPADAFLE